MASGGSNYMQIISAVQAFPGFAVNLTQICNYFGKKLASRLANNSAVTNADQETQERLLAGLREMEQRCLTGEAQVKHDINIPSEHQRRTVLQWFAGLRSLIQKDLKALERGGHDQQSNCLTADDAEEMQQVYSMLFDLAEDAWRQAFRSTSHSISADDEIGKIKEKLRKDQPLIGSRASDIFSSTDRPQSIEFAAGVGCSPFVTLDDLQCFMEYFPFGSDSKRDKSRICWMMLLLKELGCPHVMEPVKVFLVVEGSQPGFYTCSRVPTSHQPAPAIGELCTLDECVSRVRMDRRKVVIHLSLAVQELHAQTILHKNICANNVVLDENDNTWLAGLSSSRLGDQNSYKIPQEDLVRAKMVYYDSPDISNRIRSFKCDIYALGMVMLEVALGKSFVKSTEVITSKSDILNLLDHRVKAGPFKTLIYKCLAPEARSRPLAYEINSELEAMRAQDIDCSDQLTN